nr:NADH dehydrogenase subunit 5 [Ipomoea batatas]GME14978.1 NADH dehydrogenase subunit 5 [Ipomoea batatas]
MVVPRGTAAPVLLIRFKGLFIISFFNKRWFFDQVLNDFLVRSLLRFGYEVSFEALDKGAIEILGPYGISYTFRRLAERISQLQSGFVVRRMRYDPWPPAWWGRLLRCG